MPLGRRDEPSYRRLLPMTILKDSRRGLSMGLPNASRTPTMAVEQGTRSA